MGFSGGGSESGSSSGSKKPAGEKRHRFTPKLKKFFGYDTKEKSSTTVEPFSLPRTPIDDKPANTFYEGDTIIMPKNIVTRHSPKPSTDMSDAELARSIVLGSPNPGVREVKHEPPTQESSGFTATFSQMFSGPNRRNARPKESSSNEPSPVQKLPKAFSLMQQKPNMSPTGVPFSGTIEIKSGMEALMAENLRGLFISHISQNCCWAESPAESWPIKSVENSIAYVGKIEVFVEKRTSQMMKAPFAGGFVDDRKFGRPKGIWDADLPVTPPPNFLSKDFKFRNPHTDKVLDCPECNGKGHISCPSCSKPENQSDEACKECGGKKVLVCKGCDGKSQIMTREIINVSWYTIPFQYIHNEFGQTSLPNEVILNSRLTKFDVDLRKGSLPPNSDPALNNLVETLTTMRKNLNQSDISIISERSLFQSLPVTRVTMAHNESNFEFFALGKEKQIYVRNYPYRTCGFCLDWLDACNLMDVGITILGKLGIKI